MAVTETGSLPLRNAGRALSASRIPLFVALILLAPCRWAVGELTFPDDYGPHPDHRIEAWYFSGRLSAEEEQPFGFHLGFFRLGVAPDGAKQTSTKQSAWRIREIYRAELGIADLKSGRFVSDERLSRTALGLAGAQASPFKVWLYDWVVESSSASSSQPTFRLRATRGEEAVLELELKAAKRAVIPDGQPLMGAERSRNNMRWYSVTRMVAGGTLRLDERVHRVKGHVWLDRMWRDASLDFITASLGSTDRIGFLSAGQIAINRFALLLENGWELLLFQMHRIDGSGVPLTTGILVYGDGTSRALRREDLVLSERDHWISPGGARYPAAWRVTVPEDGIDLMVKAAVPDQEVRETVRYWAGAVDISGEAIGRPVSGHGHAALVGYGARPED